MSCNQMCHSPYCFDDKEHFCHDSYCSPKMAKAEYGKLPAEYQPESLREKPKPKNLPIMYAIGEWDEVKESSGMWAGPTPDVKQVLNEVGKSNQSTIFRFNSDGTDEPIYKWNESLKRWIRIYHRMVE